MITTVPALSADGEVLGDADALEVAGVALGLAGGAVDVAGVSVVAGAEAVVPVAAGSAGMVRFDRSAAALSATATRANSTKPMTLSFPVSRGARMASLARVG
ncbi:hypothetical protein LKO27_13005 [Tessaracoccus sp. OS52]|uniref:hypothetical protein n=1 Tax=Tessaracoccus sp. OS52 TaxID=2886691 RepID=UPI001D104FC0|nr:hypothetical protein [Tessaracoccus sp. OS52]MCC2594324.1 hypothetical protein [Tessaracoccus sp. OS52]